MPKIKGLTKAERKRRKMERNHNYYQKNREVVNKKARIGMRRFRARSKRKEAYASHQACKEAGELAKQKKAARYSSRALAEWPRKRSSSVITDDSNTGPIDHPKKPGDVGDGWAAEVQECLFPPLHQASALTIPTSSLRDSFDDDLPPLSPFSSEEEDDWAFSETSDSDHELPIAPYDSD